MLSMRAFPPVLIAAVALACLALAPSPQARAQTEIRRCVTDSGETIYTDRECRDVDATERLPRLTAGDDPRQSLPARGACSRRVRDLVQALTAAIDRGNVNQLASLYHWPGIGTTNGYAIMDRLDAIVQRPLVDVRLLYPVEPAGSPVASAGTPSPAPETRPRSQLAPPTAAELMQRASPWRPSGTAFATGATTPPAPGPATAGERPETGASIADDAPTPRRRSVPHALQIEQTLANSGTPSRTVFGLRQHLGCWWVSL